MGMGEDRDGIMILLSMEDRDYAMFVYGPKASEVFNAYGQEQLETYFGAYLPQLFYSMLAPVTLLTTVLHTRMVTIRIRLMPLEKAYRPISSK